MQRQNALWRCKMESFVVRSVNGVLIRLTQERWRHILVRHPETEPYRDRVLDAVKDPDFVAKGLHGELKAAKLFIDLPMGRRYLVVVYREVGARDGFIITARLGSGVSNLIKGGVVWRRK